MGEYVALEVSDGVATIQLNRPPMNALSPQVQREFAEAAGAADADDAVRVVIVYGGPKVFAAGADIKEMADWDSATAERGGKDLHAAFDAVAAIRKPTIAAITGYALGGGLELALCCDLRIAGDNVKVGLPEILLGIIPGAGGTQRLTRLVGPARAKDLILTGRFVAADEAAALGIVDRVVAPDAVYHEALALAGRLAAGAPFAQRAAKRAIDAALDGTLAEGLAVERAEFAALFATEDQTIGMRSFLARGPGKAEFVGR
jgi:enoyl-CoA hydratase/carnithine racemase